MKASRADAHIHFFEGGFQGDSFASRPGVRIDEAACYASFVEEFPIEAALVIGYEAQPWCAGNNAWIALLAADHPWMRPLAFVSDGLVSMEKLEVWRGQGFLGISLYMTDDNALRGLARIPDEVWQRLENWGWLVSVNSRPPRWKAWLPILEKHPALRLMVSHLGLPPRVRLAPSGEEARAAMAEILELARFPFIHVKLSGLYAISDPGHAHPHRAAWPYVERVIEDFGTRRILWASDFSPCLDWVTFPQTLGILDEMDFLTDEDRRLIGGANCLNLIDQVTR